MVVDGANGGTVVAAPNCVVVLNKLSDAPAQSHPSDVSANAKPVVPTPVLYPIISTASGSTASKRRIIYLRDFSSITDAAAPLVADLLQAIRMRRFSYAEGMPDAGSMSDLLQPTLLALGMAGTHNEQFLKDYGKSLQHSIVQIVILI
jgi:hypothetical protein